MTIVEAVTKIDELKPNGYSQFQKIIWLSNLDAQIKAEIIDTHEGAEDVTFTDYTENTDIDTVLLVPTPYEDLYLAWLEAKIDYTNGEYTKYNNSITLFNERYAAFERYYNRTHMPLGTKFKYF